MILCCGEALIDMLPRRSEDGEAAFVPHAGGAVFNTAIALGRLGSLTGFFSGLSDDLFGEILRASLAESHVDTRFARPSSRPTTLAFVTLTNGQATYVFYNENAADRMISPGDLPNLSGEVAVLFFGGISLISEPCGTAYETLMARESGRRLIMLDPNIRAGFITDEVAYRGRLERMIAMADLVKLSDEDLGWLLPDVDMDAAARALLDLGPTLVVITRGGEGATAYRAGERIDAAAVKAEVVDTVGAGDSYNAGILAGLRDHAVLSRPALASLSRDEIAALLGFAARVAAVTVSRAGANPPWRSELGAV